MVDTQRLPNLVLLNTKEVHDRFVFKSKNIIINNKDFVEIFNQAFDYISEDLDCNSISLPNLNLDMLYNRDLKQNGIVTKEGLILKNNFCLLCNQIKGILIDINIPLKIDDYSGDKIFPYHFLNLKIGNTLLKKYKSL